MILSSTSNVVCLHTNVMTSITSIPVTDATSVIRTEDFIIL